jgi:hypothetical protein
MLKNEHCLNKAIGGRHPNNRRTGIPHKPSTIKKISKRAKQRAAAGVLWSQQEENKHILRERMSGDNNPAKQDHVREKLRVSKLGIQNPRYGRPGTMTGKVLTSEQKQKISYTILTPGGIFNSSTDAARYYKIAQQTVINRCNNAKFLDWKILNKGQKYKV